MTTALVRLAVSLCAAIGLLPVALAADTFTGSKAGDFDLGQRLVSCAAFYAFASELTADLNKPAAVEHFQNLSNGWSIAGMLMLSSGATQKRFDAKETAAAIRSARLTALRAKAEVGGADALTAMQTDHARECDPLVPLQENIIATLRQGVTAQGPRKK